MSSQASLAELKEALRHADPARRRAAAEALTAHGGPEAVEALMAALGDPHWMAHEAIIRGVAALADGPMIPRLVALLHGDETSRRNAAMSVLVDVGERALDLLVQSLADPAPETRLHVAEILGDLHDAGAVETLLARLGDSNEAPNVRHACATALGKLGDPRAVDGLAAAAAEGDFWVRYAAIEALGRLGDRMAVPTLTHLLDTDAWTRTTSAQALGVIGDASALQALARHLDDANEAVRGAAIEAIVKILAQPRGVDKRSPSDLTPLRSVIPVQALTSALESRQSPAAAYAAHLLGSLEVEEALPALLAAINADDAGLRFAVKGALLHFGARATPALVDLLSDPDPTVREEAAEMLGLLEDRQALHALAAALADPALSVRQAVVRALGALGENLAFRSVLLSLNDPDLADTGLAVLLQMRSPRTAARLRESLYAADADTSAAAARALSALGDEESAGLLVDALRGPEAQRRAAGAALPRIQKTRAVSLLAAALTDPDWYVRERAARGLGSIADGPALAALAGLLADPDWRVRRALVDIFREVKDERAIGRLIELAKDRDRWVRRPACHALGAYRSTAVTQLLAERLNDPDAGVRQAAAHSLGHAGAPEALEALRNRLGHEADASVREDIVAAMSGFDEVQAEYIAEALLDAEWTVRRQAVETLGDITDPAAMPMLGGALRDLHPEVRAHAARALGHLASPEAAEALVSGLGFADLRPHAIAALSRIGPPALPALLCALGHADPAVRAAAAESLGLIGDYQAAVPLQALLTDADLGVRRAAEAALEAL